MEVLCYLNDVLIDEPAGLESLELSLIRDGDYHGIGFEASTGTLQFRGNGRDILNDYKTTDGIESVIIFRVDLVCADNLPAEIVYEGRMNMGTFREICGLDCYVEIQTEENSCMVKLKSRFDQSVDLDATVTFDKTTAVISMPTMIVDLPLTGVKTDARIEAAVIDGGVTEVIPVGEDFAELNGFGMFIKPDYSNVTFNGITTGNPESLSYELLETDMAGVTPILLLEERNECYSDEFEYSFRFKGSMSFPANAEGLNIDIHLKLWNGIGDWQFAPTVLEFELLYSADDYLSGDVIAFDGSFSGSVAMVEGQSLYAYIVVSTFNTDPAPPFDLTITFDPETNVLITNIRDCPDSNTDAYLIHETLSRVVECVTDQCAVVKSEYYGRTDSMPYSFPEFGCGGHRVTTSGLKIRHADNPFFFASFKQLIEGLNAIDNIGFGIEDGDFLPGIKNIRIEPVEFFYQDVEIASFDHIPEGATEIREEMYYSILKIGYRKWEVQKFNGLNEFNSTRQYRTNFDTINKTLERESELVAGSLAIESTRQQSFAASGAADTTYDNEIFIICVLPVDDEYVVELENYSFAANIFAPETMYNMRISPARNGLRWFKSVANGYADIFAANSVLFFASGTGNVVAEIQMVDDGCTPEIVPVAENDDLNWAMMELESPPEFIWKNETFTFEYPLSLAGYKAIKATPYGFINYQCGDGAFLAGFIKELRYRPIEGMANFTLIKRHNTE